jgi:hypothetical protein
MFEPNIDAQLTRMAGCPSCRRCAPYGRRCGAPRLEFRSGRCRKNAKAASNWLWRVRRATAKGYAGVRVCSRCVWLARRRRRPWENATGDCIKPALVAAGCQCNADADGPPAKSKFPSAPSTPPPASGASGVHGPAPDAAGMPKTLGTRTVRTRLAHLGVIWGYKYWGRLG